MLLLHSSRFHYVRGIAQDIAKPQIDPAVVYKLLRRPSLLRQGFHLSLILN